MKRADYISWDEYFMGIAMLAAKRSKDPNTQVGACIVSEDNIIISTGYNGMPKGCSDDEFPWNRDGTVNKYADSMSTLASKRMLTAAGVSYRQLKTDLKSITLDFIPEEDKK